MSGNHNMNQKITGTLFSANQVDAIEKAWRDKCQRYIEIHDAVVKDSDELYQLLREAENEMRYAGWGIYSNDNPARFELFKTIQMKLGIKGNK